MLTKDQRDFVENMRSASDEFSPYTGDEIARLISLIDSLESENKTVLLRNIALQAKLDALESADRYEPIRPNKTVDVKVTQHSPAPNGGETAAVAPHSELGRDDDAQRRDAMREAYKQADAEDRGEPERSGPFDHDPLGTGAPDVDPQPAAPRKLSKGVKLTAAQETVLQIAVRRGGQMRGDDPALIFRGAAQSLQACVKRDWLTFNYERNRYTIMPAGRAVLASESEAGK